MNRRFSSPFANIESRGQALSMARYSVAGFGLWGLVVLVQAGLVWWSPERADSAGSTLGFLVFQAIIAGVAAVFQLRKPNRILPVFGVAWSLFEVSSLMVGLMVGMPMAVSGLPAWAAALTAGVMMVCVVLHVGGLRGTVALSRFS